ncbi:penicillin-binding protein [Frankia sp. R43]|uniref:serine/threonine-protein kinase n=1 Tax=Frankia sp. R43 TaxID=269536 RepID=UPI0006CA0281|nr:serine/threonine-protein kinase [Frankia sp. R43]KPM57255.1 penicillin-binding protein [Frankia sp. R43]
MRKLGSRYVLHELIGQGTAGQVWRGAHVPDGEPVAIKVLRPELAHDPEVVDRFLRECDLLVRLDSPELVRVRDLIKEPGTLAIVMDLVEGIDLRAHLDQSGPRPVTEAARLVIGLLWALDSVHDAGIIHRDVKPENVLIDTSDPRRPYVRLTDFGVARMIHTPGRASLTGPIGTPLYMAPELADDVPPTPSVDIYAAGVVLYELIAGSPPFDHAHPADLMRAHREEQPLPIQGVPTAVWDVLASMLAKSPKQRPATAADAAEDLLDALEDDDRDHDHDFDQDSGNNNHTTRIDRAERPGAAGRSGTASRSGAAGRRHGAPAGRDAAFDAALTQVGGIAPVAATSLLAAGTDATGAHSGWNDAANTQVAGIPPARADWDAAAHTQIAGMPPVRPDRAGAGAGPGTSTDWSDAATGAQPAVRVPARSAGSASDRNTVISKSKDSAPAGAPGAGAGAPSGRSAADRRRRSRIAAGAGLVVALVAGAGGWALAAAGGGDTTLTTDSNQQMFTDDSGVVATLPGGSPMPPGMAPPAAGTDGRSTGAARGTASGRPGQSTSPGASATQSGTASPSASTSPSASPTTKDGTVPDVTNQSKSAATSTLSGKGFTNVATSETCRKGESGGIVLGQSPNAGSVVPVSTKITLTVQATDCVEVPSVAGSSLSAARSKLTSAGLGVLDGGGGCQWGTTSTAARTNPSAGTMMHKGENVWLEPNCSASPAPAPTTPAATRT